MTEKEPRKKPTTKVIHVTWNDLAGHVLEKIPFRVTQIMAARRYSRAGLAPLVEEIIQRNHFSGKKTDLILADAYDKSVEQFEDPLLRLEVVKQLGEGDKRYLDEFLQNPEGYTKFVSQKLRNKANSLRRKYQK